MANRSMRLVTWNPGIEVESRIPEFSSMEKLVMVHDPALEEATTEAGLLTVNATVYGIPPPWRAMVVRVMVASLEGVSVPAQLEGITSVVPLIVMTAVHAVLIVNPGGPATAKKPPIGTAFKGVRENSTMLGSLTAKFVGTVFVSSRAQTLKPTLGPDPNSLYVSVQKFDDGVDVGFVTFNPIRYRWPSAREEDRVKVAKRP
jgi:hypothetical protein